MLIPWLFSMQADRINDLLPQTQCTKCGYQGCLPYAQAIAHDQVPINRCPPGGEQGIAALSQLLGVPILPLDLSCGEHLPLQVARIDEQYCIGCTLCIQACPVDAILGANKFMHAILSEDCTGCGLCVAPCPVDCIEMVTLTPPRSWTAQDGAQARGRYDKRQTRIAQASTDNIRAEAIALNEAQKKDDNKIPASTAATDVTTRQAAIASALARARARRTLT